jgi:histidine triad (HIT) family protein
MKYSGEDFYCDVALAGSMPLEIKYESENVLAYNHTSPYCPVHIVVIPKKHIASFVALTPEETPILLEIIDVLKVLAKKMQEEFGAARILTNLGEYQHNKHLHFHISYGEPLEKK